jgi:hypothetical protein
VIKEARLAPVSDLALPAQQPKNHDHESEGEDARPVFD